MAPMQSIQRSVSLQNDVRRPAYIRRSVSVICPSTCSGNPPIPTNTGITGGAIPNLLMDAAAQINQANQVLGELLGVTPDSQDALNILPGLAFLVKAPDLSIDNLNYVIYMLTQVQSYLQTSRYHKLTIFIEKSKNAIEQVRTRVQNANNNLASSLQQQQQQQQYPTLIANSPEVVLSVCVVLTNFLVSF